MSKSYLQRLASLTHLRKAWLYLSDGTPGSRRQSSGVDGRTVNQFASRTDENLETIRHQLLSTTGYIFSDLKPRLEVKDSGGYRVICVPTVNDRVVQRALLDILQEKQDYRFESEISFGFLRGRTVQQAVGKAATLRDSHGWVYQTDITKFFDEISRDLIKKNITRRIRPRSLHELLFNVVQCEIKRGPPEQEKRISANGIKRGKGLRQGMPASPYLSNLFLFDFDKTIVNRNIAAVRYADDLIFLGDTYDDCLSVHDLCQEELHKLGLRIDPIGQGKTQVYDPSQGVEFLGVNIAQSPTGYAPFVSAKKKGRMKSELLELSNMDKLIARGLTITDLAKLLENKIAGWNATYQFCANHQKVADALESFRKTVISEVFQTGLGVTLSRRNKKFLGIEK